MSAEVKLYHPIYQGMYDYEFMLYPLAAGAVGFINLGPYGALGGATFGAIDAVAMHYKIYNNPCLTSAILSWGISYSFPAPYNLNQVAGFALGALLSTGIFDQYYDKIAVPVSGAFMGSIAGSPYGAAIGLVAGIADEAASYYNLTNEYHLTSALNNLAMLNIYAPKLANILPTYLLFINSPVFKFSIAGILSALALYTVEAEEDVKEELAVLVLKKKIYESYSKVIAKEQLDDLMQKKFIAITAIQFFTMKATLALAVFQQNIAQDFHNLEIEGFAKFLEHFKGFALFLPVLTTNYAIEGFVSSYFSARIFSLVQDRVFGDFYEGEVALHLSKNSSSNAIDANTLLKNMDDDIDNVIDLGANLLSNGFGSIIKGIYAAAHLYNSGAADMVVHSQVYNALTSYITKFLSNKIEQDADDIKMLESQLASIDEYTRNHASEMVQNDATSLVSKIRNKVSDKVKILYSSRDIYTSMDSLWQNVDATIDFFFNYLVIANKVTNGELNFDKRFEVLFIISDVSSMIGWEVDNINAMTKLNQSMTRFNEFNLRMDEVNLPLKHVVHYNYEKSTQVGVCFNNLTIGMKSETILYIDNVCLWGRNIALNGPSGGGKTSFFKVLKQIKYDDVWGEGNITFHSITGEASKPAMVSQKNCIPPYASLLELITYKEGEEAKQYEEQVIKLMQEIKINTSIDGKGATDLIARLHNKEAWENILSGGQIQKLYILKVILEKPDRIFGDEMLKELDPASIIIVKAMLSKYLPSTQIINIDHEMVAHNLDGFYDSNLHFENKTAILGDLNSEGN